jgi:hypothetical protein
LVRFSSPPQAAQNAEASQRGKERLSSSSEEVLLLSPNLCETSAFCGASGVKKIVVK